MANNEILPFSNVDTGTNLLTQAEYLDDIQRTNGNQPGVARSKLVNKVLRQVSLLSSGVAKFIADYQENNVTDSLTPQNIANYLKAAIQANIPIIEDASLTTKGKIQLANALESQNFSDSTKAITPTTLNQSFMGTNQSLLSNGYQRLPGGLIIQWGYISNWTTVGDSTYSVTFPLAFPNSIFHANWIRIGISTAQIGVPMIQGFNNKTGMTIILDKQSDLLETRDAAWLAIGF